MVLSASLQILEQESSDLARENEEWRKEMKEFEVRKLFSRTRPAGDETVMPNPNPYYYY